eukprot:TRINITY_DN12226_c0_g1_i2.p2 TRINITY_DN12226_c0_g1~~TRINITY_DN12226_c0_g1_i2.p2  ORF type:complete len:227 (-),score=49.76 TRINITY_DN12226_c0_g1_i2:75-728(-)
MAVEEKLGDLLDAQEQYIVQQCNCVTKYAAGLAAAIADRFPHADVYNSVAREARGTQHGDVPGTILVLGGPLAETDKEKRGIINMFAQFCPGKANRGSSGPVEYKGLESSPDVVDNAAQRLTWFKAGLQQISEISGLESVAFPHQIGCGLAGGKWSDYKAALDDFCESVEPRGVRVVVYKKEEVDAWPCSDCQAMTPGEQGRYWKTYWYCKPCYNKY